jgi:tetratricopeptide (TPR) repeat protein
LVGYLNSYYPNDPYCFFDLGIIYRETGRDNLAVDIYMKALLRDPEFTIDFRKDGKLLPDLDIP